MERRYPKLRGRIVEKYGTIGEFAKAAKVPRNTLYSKLNGIRKITQSNMKEWGMLLDIPTDEYYDYYF